jgi:predicted RNA polymerase sigma factor
VRQRLQPQTRRWCKPQGSAAAPNAHPAAALCWESIRLARALAAHPAAAHPEAYALAAPLLLHGARLSGQLDPTAAPRLGHAIAHAEAGEPAQALQWLQALQPELPSALRAHGLAAQARAHERLGQCAPARQLLHAAAEAASHPAEARALRHRADELEADGRHWPSRAAPCR